MVDVDTTEFKNFVHLCINTDCYDFLNQIQDINYSNKEWLNECNNLKNKFPVIEKTHIDEIFPNSYKIIDKIFIFINCKCK
jgi:acetolactate synthase-1/2/3 large subunit